MQIKKAYERSHHRSAKRSGIPCTMALRLTPRSSRRSGFLVTVTGAMQSIVAGLTSASRRQNHVASPYALRALVSRTESVHRIPRPTFSDDRETPLYPGAQDPARSARDLPDVTSKSACDTMTRRANQVVFRRTRKTDVNGQLPVREANTRSRIFAAQRDWEARDRAHSRDQLAAVTVRRARGCYFRAFCLMARLGMTTVEGSQIGTMGKLGVTFMSLRCEKPLKNRGRKQKNAKNPEKNCVEASSPTQGTL